MALFRALESRRRRARLFDDPFAVRFLGPDLSLAAAAAAVPLVGGLVPWLIDRRWPGPHGSAVVRTRLIDDAVVEAVRRGTTQLVLLGAGFDCRPYRLVGLEHVRVFEVDRPATLARKRIVVAHMLGGPPPSVAFVPLDLEQQALDAALVEAGYRPELPAVVVWEGVTNYLTADAVDRTLRLIVRLAAPGSVLVFTYIHRAMLDGSAQASGVRQWVAAVRSTGEPFTFGFEPSELPEYLAERGLRVVEDVSAADAAMRYLPALGRRVVASPFYHVCRAERAGGSAAAV
jgi:methyltransferase (TIGR00027 family)